MVYYMPGETTVPKALDDEQLTPRQIVAELDRYIIGQDRAKRAVAIALRNRIRRLRLPPEMAEEVAPKNIIMIGPTGVGKTEIARRLARLARSPFMKVEATKFTEVGYVGRDVESMVRDLAEIAVDLVRQEKDLSGGKQDRRGESVADESRQPPRIGHWIENLDCRGRSPNGRAAKHHDTAISQ